MHKPRVFRFDSAAGLTACSGDEEKDKSSGPSEETESQGVDPGRVSPTDLPEVPEIKKVRGAISDVLARGVAVVEGLGAGESKEIEVKTSVPDGVTTCTFHVVRGNLP